MENELSVPVEEVDLWFFGLRGSGEDLVLDWMLGHKENWCHYDNCWVSEDGSIKSSKKIDQGESSELTIASFEDFHFDLQELENAGVPISDIVLLTRDVVNNFASRYNEVQRFIDGEDVRFFDTQALLPSFFEKWKAQANAYLNKDIHTINFNTWCSCVDYRKELSGTFGWENSQEVSQIADPRKEYEKISDDEEFLASFDEDSLSLSNQIDPSVSSLDFDYQKEYVERVQEVVTTVVSLVKHASISQSRLILEQANIVYPKSLSIQQVSKIFEDRFSEDSFE